MYEQNDEKGYALIIVLFTIVFITVLTAVFMRGALSNATQEKTLDENNLVVVSAESGVDYYTWKLKQIYDEETLQKKFTELVNDAVEAEDSPIDYVDIQEEIASDFQIELEERANSLKNEGAIELFSNYNHKLIAAIVERTELDGDIILTIKGIVEGELQKSAKLKKKEKELEFELTYVFPKVAIEDDDDDDSTGGILVKMPEIKSPRTPKTPIDAQMPIEIMGIATKQDPCLVKNNKIDGQKCFVKDVHEGNYNINKSEVYVENTLSSWGTIRVENTHLNILQGLTAEKVNVVNTELVIGNSLKGNNLLDINNSKLKVKNNIDGSTPLTIANSQLVIGGSVTSNNASISKSNLSAKELAGGALKITDSDVILEGKINGNPSAFVEKTNIRVKEFYGSATTLNEVQLVVSTLLEFHTANVENSVISANSYKADTQANFNKTDIKVMTNYNSGGAKFENSILEVGGTVVTGGGLFDIEGSSVMIVGNATTHNGSKIKKSLISIGGNFSNESKPLDADESDIKIGGLVTAHNGTDLKKVNMAVLGDYNSSTDFKLHKTNLSIGGKLSSGNGGDLNESLLIAKQISANTPLKLQKSVVFAEDIQTDVMMLIKSKMCVKNFKGRSFTMDDNSEVFYSDSFNIDNNASTIIEDNIIKLSSDEFEAKCGVSGSTSEQTGKIDWKPPVLDKVIY